MARQHDFIYCAVGIHPHCASGFNKDSISAIRELAAEPKCVAIGEIGLDYHYDFSPRDIQKTAFEAQLALAKELDMPVVVHDREAHKDTLDILEASGLSGEKVLIHCFTGSREIASILMKRGYYVSIGGAVTFKNARHIIEAIEVIPLDRILLETDCPYMTPVPFRGKRNDSSFIPYTAARISEVKSVLLDSFYLKCRENTVKFYGLKL